MGYVGKVVMVTGAGGGIGGATAQHLVELGATVVGGDLPDRFPSGAARPVHPQGSAYETVALDIADPIGVDRVVADVLAAHGRLDVLVNVAAITGSALDDDTDIVTMVLGTWDRVLDVNLRGTMLMCRAAIPAMLAGGGGAIVNISSRAATGGGGRFGAYAVSKAGVNTLTRHIATVFGRQGIRCNAIMPGLIDGTEAMTSAAMTPDRKAAAIQRSLVGRAGTATDVAAMVAFLADDEHAGYVNGQVMNCDGGSGM